MTSTTMAIPASQPSRKSASLKRDRRWALITSYVFLVIFAIFFLVAALLHGGDGAQERCRGRPHGDQSLDRCQRIHA